MNVTDPIRAAARRQPGALAYTGVPNRMEVTFAQLDRAIDAFAARALDAGLREGQTAIVELAEEHAHLVATLALIRIGVAAAAPTLPERFAAARLCAAATTAATLREVHVDRTWFLPGTAREAPPSAPGGAATCAIFGTSGTTGVARHFAVTHDMLARRLAVAEHTMPLPPAPRVMIKIGLRTSFAFLMTLQTLYAGGLAAFPRYDEVTPAIRARRINVLFMAPATASTFLQTLPADPDLFPSLERVYLSGGTVPRRLLAEARERLCRDVRVSYGATEVGSIAGAALDALADTPNAVGIVAPGAEVQCVDAADRECPRDTEGVVRIRRNPGSGVYLDAPEASQDAFRGDWFYPGDTGSLSADGMLVITGRVSEAVNVGGEKRSPRVIEDRVRGLGDVADVAVFTAPDALGVSQLHVAVVGGPALDLRALVDRCVEARVVPARTRFLAVPALPRNEFGKLARNELPQLVAAADDGAGATAPAAAVRATRP
ncbi:MAG: class I adenylate-forming enzyme family protein [Burkholderiales bacterium]